MRTATAPKSETASRPSARAGAGIAPAVAAARRADGDTGWSIDDEQLDRGWHESSWLLRRGLDVIEGVAPQFWPLEWRRAWQ